jgi:hypothetical protein
MTPTKLLFALAIAAAFAGNAEAVYKCTTAKGVVYQDRPCYEGAQSDVRIVVPTGQVVVNDRSKAEAAQSDAPRSDVRAAAAKPARNNDATTSTDVRLPSTAANNAPPARSASAGAVRSNPANAASNESPMTPEQASNTEPTAKYYTTDAAASGNETPSRMTCESPNGEKRIFILTNGKLTSI